MQQILASFVYNVDEVFKELCPTWKPKTYHPQQEDETGDRLLVVIYGKLVYAVPKSWQYLVTVGSRVLLPPKVNGKRVWVGVVTSLETDWKGDADSILKVLI